MDGSFRPQPEAPGGQTPWTPAVPSQPTASSTGPTHALATSGKRFECSVPGCGRHFTRKEHLTRHVKSHSSHFQHQCPICGRRYARSDVLKRHIEFHPQNSSRSHKLVACVSCRERKLKCDEDTPCQSCSRNRVECVRAGHAPETAPGDATNKAADAEWHVDLDVGMTNANLAGENEPQENSLPPDITVSGMDVVASAWPAGSHDQQPWMQGQQPQYDWSLSSLPSLASPKSALSDAHAGQVLAPWPMLTGPPSSQPSAAGLTGVADLGLPRAPPGASPGQASPGVVGDQFANGGHHVLNLGQLSSTWHLAKDDGMADAPSRDKDETAAAAVGTARSKTASSISSRVTDHGFSAALSQARSSATSASPGRDPASEGRGLHSLVHHDSAALHDLVKIFFAEIHPYWPILHAPTFETGMASDTLLGAMLMLSSWVVGRQEHLELAPAVFDDVTNATGPESVPSLHSLQALLLCIIYAVCCRSEESMLAKAVRLNAVLVSTCRCLDIFSGHHVLPDRLEECAFTLWLAKEQLHRLAFSVLRLDTYLSILLDHPPSVRYQELCIPLPKSSQLWMAASEDERRKLQWDEPAGREKALFSYLIRDALLGPGDGPGSHHLPYRLSAVDYHLGLCAMQVGIWEAAREAHSAASDEIVTKLMPGDPIVIWRSHLSQWRTRMVQECRLSEQSVAAMLAMANHASPDSVLTPLTLMLWHISTIKMHAPLTLLRVHGSLLHGFKGPNLAAAAAMAAVQKPKARLRTWMASQCPRKAVWSASQIARLVAGDGAAGTPQGQQPYSSADARPDAAAVVRPPPRRLLLNPLAVPGLLMSAIVTCSYASQINACPACSPSAANLAFDLFSAADDDAELARWKEHGLGWAVWGPSGIFVCRCRLPALGEWFARVLARDQGAKAEFEAFFEGLA